MSGSHYRASCRRGGHGALASHGSRSLRPELLSHLHTLLSSAVIKLGGGRASKRASTLGTRTWPVACHCL